MKPIPFNALAKDLGLHHPNQTLVTGAAIDSRKLNPGDLFFALPGNRVDGHDFLEQIARRGASGAVVREDYRGETFGLPLLRVPDVLLALQDLARRLLEKRRSQVIAITGSLGKTTVKEFAAALIRPSYKIFASPLSYNSQATVPLSILLADGTEDYIILEMGMTHKGHLANLVSIAPPDIAMVTTVAVQHAVNFSDGLAGISREKASIFSHPKTRLGLLHRDIRDFEEVYNTGSCPKKTFSTSSAEADYFLEQIPSGVRIYVQGEHAFEIPLALPVKEHYQNFLAAVILARSLNISWELIREAAAFIRLPSMRFEKVVKKGILFINDAYNANPDSMRAALENLPKPRPGGKVIAVLSEMDALGIYCESGHTLVAEIALKHADILFCLGKRCETMCEIWKREKKPVELFESRQDLESALMDRVKAGDVVLLKGARAYSLDQILDKFE
ncbi:MAG: UDP-N-acetylmuramoyl-tripeptide--D-alanyl-D-alanine ligase [Chlamydiales bacterium]|nr:UDP-N-acetylmuramoyl-tripeptide--D-alanyl-D-alanine ligase [Chlamydiales bacterium]